MAQKKRSTSKRKATTKPKRSTNTVSDITKALDALPLPARAIVSQHIDQLDRMKRRYPVLYEVMFKNVDSERYREFERDLERAQELRRGGA